MNEIINRLFKMQDSSYRDFQSALIPTVDKNTIIGVRTPLLRAYSKEIYNTNMAERFLDSLPHRYYEENNLHAFLIERIRNYDECIKRLDQFLPHVDNWATCDSMSPSILKKHPDELLIKIYEWIQSDDIYTVRFSIGLLMKYYLDENFDVTYLKLVANVKSDEYYIKMMVSWYFATALAKQYDSAVGFLEKHMLEPWIHNKTIQKARESYRITEQQKEYLKSIKV